MTLSYLEQVKLCGFSNLPKGACSSSCSNIWPSLDVHTLFLTTYPFYNFSLTGLFCWRILSTKLHVAFWNALWIRYDQQKKRGAARSKRTWNFTCFSCESKFPFLLDKHQEVGLLGSGISASLSLWEGTQLFSKVVAAVMSGNYNCSSALLGPNLINFQKDFSHSNRCGGLSWVSLIINDAEHIYIWLFAIYICSLVSCLVKPFAYF